MAGNHLEQLVAEWYEYQGYFVRQNVLVGRRENGGYECELDVVAFHPESKRVVHVEPSLDANTWERREERYGKKFAAGCKYIPKLLKGLGASRKIEQIALLGAASKANRNTLAGGRLMLVGELLSEIGRALLKCPLASKAVPEHLPLLRTLQYATAYRQTLAQAWGVA